MDTYKAIMGRRSIRRFKDKEVPEKVLEKCVNAGRLSPTGNNLQPLKFITVTKKLKEVFPHTHWAGSIKDWNPSEDEMPRAYIAILKKKGYGLDLDIGIAAQSICLTAYDEGVASCMLLSIDKEELSEMLPVPDDYELRLMVAMGYPDEKSEVISSEETENLKYRYEGETLKVPKRSLDEVWIKW